MSVNPSSERASEPRVVAVLSAKGGCGATTLAVNLAVEQARSSLEGSTCLVDMDFCKGDVAASLSLWPEFTLKHATEAKGLDPTMLRGLTTQAHSGLCVLGQPHDLGELEVPTAEAVARLLELARQTFERVFVDCGSRVDEATMGAALSSDLVVLVTRPQIPDLRDAGRVIDLLVRLSVPRERLLLVVNNRLQGQGVSKADIETQLEQPVFFQVGQNALATRAIERAAAPLCEVARLSPLLRDVRGLLRSLDAQLDGDALAAAPESKPGSAPDVTSFIGRI